MSSKNKKCFDVFAYLTHLQIYKVYNRWVVWKQTGSRLFVNNNNNNNNGEKTGFLSRWWRSFVSPRSVKPWQRLHASTFDFFFEVLGLADSAGSGEPGGSAGGLGAFSTSPSGSRGRLESSETPKNKTKPQHHPGSLTETPAWIKQLAGVRSLWRSQKTLTAEYELIWSLQADFQLASLWGWETKDLQGRFFFFFAVVIFILPPILGFGSIFRGFSWFVTGLLNLRLWCGDICGIWAQQYSNSVMMPTSVTDALMF